MVLCYKHSRKQIQMETDTPYKTNQKKASVTTLISLVLLLAIERAFHCNKRKRNLTAIFLLCLPFLLESKVLESSSFLNDFLQAL